MGWTRSWHRVLCVLAGSVVVVGEVLAEKMASVKDPSDKKKKTKKSA